VTPAASPNACETSSGRRYRVVSGLHRILIPDVTVVAHEPRLDEPLRRAAAAMREATEMADVIAAVRAMYKRVGLDPTKTRPSSEALLRRVRRGEELPRINNVVDVVNWCSLESQLPFGLYDADKIHGRVELRLGREGEEYAGIRKDTVHLAGRLTLADELGPFGNPTSDSARTMVTDATVRVMVVVFAPESIGTATVDRILETTKSRIREYCVQPGRTSGSE
jgi:DNA/RNA-binding domain of Phe-tRNA-synthetase-like protein